MKRPNSNNTKNETRICANCNQKKSLQKDYYKSNLFTNNYRMHICKDCAKNIDNIDEVKHLLCDNNIVFLESIWENIASNCKEFNDILPEYLKNIFCLSQYKDLRWSDSSHLKTDATSIDSSVKDFEYPRSIIQVLKNELIQLEGKIIKARKTENWGTYKNLILAYKEVFMLIENTFNTHQLTLEQIDRLITE